jgi:hypothetical protein
MRMNGYADCPALKWSNYFKNKTMPRMGTSLAAEGLVDARERVRLAIFFQVLVLGDFFSAVGGDAPAQFAGAIDGVQDVLAELEKMARECEDECDKLASEGRLHDG